MLRASLWLAATVQYLERSLLLLVTSASDLTMPAIKFCSVLFGLLVKACCHKQDSLMHGGQRDKRTSTLSAVNYSTVYQSSILKPDIGLKSRFLPTAPAFDAPVSAPRRNIAITFRITYTNLIDGQTAGTARRHRPRLCIASRGKK